MAVRRFRRFPDVVVAARMGRFRLPCRRRGRLPPLTSARSFASLLPLTLLWLLLRRSPYAVQQVSLCGTEKCGAFAALFLYRPVFGDLPVPFRCPRARC